MKVCIGIISYLPDNSSVREVRRRKMLQLIDTCNKLFNLPILIVAQNWKDTDIKSYSPIYNTSNCQVFKYAKPLGIIGARNELRKKFLESDYDYSSMPETLLKIYYNDSVISLEKIKEVFYE